MCGPRTKSLSYIIVFVFKLFRLLIFFTSNEDVKLMSKLFCGNGHANPLDLSGEFKNPYSEKSPLRAVLIDSFREMVKKFNGPKKT